MKIFLGAILAISFLSSCEDKEENKAVSVMQDLCVCLEDAGINSESDIKRLTISGDDSLQANVSSCFEEGTPIIKEMIRESSDEGECVKN